MTPIQKSGSGSGGLPLMRGGCLMRARGAVPYEIRRSTEAPQRHSICRVPRIYRSMYHDGQRPLVGRERNQLGARLPPDSPADVVPDAMGHVDPGRGMSVVPAWRQLPALLIPRRLKDKAPKARGRDTLGCWRHGDGDFADGPVANGLLLKRSGEGHGEVGPAERASVDHYQACLGATVANWILDET